MTTVADLTEFLIADAQDSDPVDLDYINGLLAEAKAKITGGKGEVAPLREGSVGGKTWARDVQLSAIQVAQACRRALAYLAESEGAGSPVTFIDFSRSGSFGGPSPSSAWAS